MAEIPNKETAQTIINIFYPFFVVSLGFAYYAHGECAADNVFFLTQHTYQVFKNDHAFSAVSIDKDIISSFAFIPATSDRSPPL